MTLLLYEIINDPLPKLSIIKENQVDDNVCKSYENMVNCLNQSFHMDKLTSEHIYSLGYTYGLIPKGILLCGLGNQKETQIDIRSLAIGLLLIGAERFSVFHNHPGYSKEISSADIQITQKLKELSEIIGIEFDKHIMITKNYWDICEDNNKECIFGQIIE